MSGYTVEEVINPNSIAVVGATEKSGSSGRQFFSALIEYGFKGELYPINPGRDNVLGYKAYPTVADVPGPVDYVISCIPATGAVEMMKSCAEKGVKGVHLFTARFSETGRSDAADMEQEIKEIAEKAGVRIIGPNCMGLYNPGLGISFSDALPKKAGRTALISQSGQVAEEVVRLSLFRGVYFNKAVSYGNALDFNECDFLDHFAADPATDIILMYLEGARDGTRFFDSLKKAARLKPVIVLKGGRGESGRRMAASHTSSLAGSGKIVSSMITQAGAVYASDFEEMLDLAATFTHLPAIKGKRVGVSGGGGGASVLGADRCEEAGLKVIALPDAIREKLKAQGSTIWDWINNPADMSIRDSKGFGPGTMLSLMSEDENFDVLLAIMSDPHHEHQKGMNVPDYMTQFDLDTAKEKPVLAIVPDIPLGGPDFDKWSWKIVCELRTALLEKGIPFYPTINRAARAASKAADYYQGLEHK